jgi:hypothetical protein
VHHLDEVEGAGESSRAPYIGMMLGLALFLRSVLLLADALAVHYLT